MRVAIRNVHAELAQELQSSRSSGRESASTCVHISTSTCRPRASNVRTMARDFSRGARRPCAARGTDSPMPEWDDVERRTIEAVERLGLPFAVIACDPEFADTAAFCERYDSPLDHAANTIVVATKREPRVIAACVVLATTRLDVNHAVRQVLGSGRMSFASADEMKEWTGMTVGGVTVFGLPSSMPLLVDARVMEKTFVVLGTGGRHGKIQIAPAVFEKLPSVTVADLAASLGG